MIDTTNANSFGYEYEDLEISILGGLNDRNYDSLRVTLRIKRKDTYHTIRHSIDLYNSSSVERLVTRIAERLETGVLMPRKAMMEMTDELERMRDTYLNEEQNLDTTEYAVTEEELEEAESILQSGDLLEVTNSLIGGSGIIGEEKNRLLMYLIFTSRKTNDPLHCISFGSSGAGKTHLQSKVAELIPSEDKVPLTTLSANAFYYFNQHELKNKLILIEDLDGAQDGLLPLRELQTKKSITKSVVEKGVGGKGRTYNKTVEGPVCVSGCTTRASVYEDNSNRSFLLYIDESSEQDERIMKYQRKKYAGLINEDEEYSKRRLLQNVQRLLKPIKVINPYAEYLELPKSVFKPRRTNIHYLQLIEVITFYHQRQRREIADEVTGEVYIETTLEDIRLANTLIKDVLLRKSDRLNGVTRDYLESLYDYLKVEDKTKYSSMEIRQEFRVNESTLRRYHKSLVSEGYITRCTEKDGQSFIYEIVDINEFRDLETTIENALNLCLDNVSSSQVRHSDNDELKKL